MSASSHAFSSTMPAPSLARVVANFVFFQIAWFACVVGAAHDMAWVGLLAVAAACAWHLTMSLRYQPEALLLIAALLIGAVWESALVASGVLTYPHGTVIAGLAPPWIVAMWPLFATTLNVALRWLKSDRPAGRWLLAAVLGGVGGPMSFLGGQRLGAVSFSNTTFAMLVLAAGWALLMPVMIWLAARYDGVLPKHDLSIDRSASRD